MNDRFIRLLRWSERYTKTDMVYLAQAGWWMNLGTVIAMALGLILSITFANVLTPDTYGLYQYLLSISVLIAAISLPGMNVAVLNATAQGHEGALRDAVRAQLRWAPVPCLVSIIAASYYFLHGNAAVGTGLAFIAVLTPLSNVFNTYVGFLEGRREFKTEFYLSVLISVISYGSLLLAALWLRNGVTLLVVNLAVNTIAMIYAYVYTLRKYHPNTQGDPHAITYGHHLSVMSAFTTAMNQIDTILVFHFLGAAQLVVYSLATMLPERIGTLFNFIGTATMPKFANHTLDYIRETLLGKIMRIAFAALILSLLYAIVAPFIFVLLFPRYISAISFSIAYAPIIALIAVLGVTNATLTAKRLTKDIYILNFVQPILLICFQIPLLLAYGIIGMIFARLVTDIIGIAFSIVLIYKPVTVLPEIP